MGKLSKEISRAPKHVQAFITKASGELDTPAAGKA
jgi:hypothetical protein